MNRNRLLIIFVIVFVDMLGFSLILPLLPYYAGTFGANNFTIGVLVAAYAAAQLIAAPVLGRLSDRFGRRPILLISILGTFLGFLILGLARTLWMLFASRILDGITGGNITVAQSYISDVSDEKNRAKSFGLIGAAFGLGFIIGPAVGGVLSAGGHYGAPALIAALLAFINLILVGTWLPESLTEVRRTEIASHPRPPITLAAMFQALSKPRVGPLLQTRFFFGLAFAMFQTIFSQYAKSLGLSVQSTGFILTYVGLISVFVQGFAIGKLTRHFRETRLIFAAAGLMALGFAGWALTSTIPPLLIVLAVIGLSGGVLNTVLSSSLSKSVYPEEIGGTLGLSTSIESLTRVIAPTLGGYLLGQLGRWAPGVVSAGIMVWVFYYTWRRLVQCPDPPLPVRNTETYAPVKAN
jgi:DHA1 family tetracycline resistance protein-like MFS transporter